MASYVNDLRLKEIGTGESSGTWGTETNTNLELIGDALGFGTEAITTNADTHTTTVADGSADAGRAMYIKYTGTLDSACTITIGPNTINRMHFIENATTGSQNIIISQGTGSNVTIPAGDVKAVYLDGAGSGAAVADAFTDLNLAGTTTVSVLSVSSTTTFSDDVTFTGASNNIVFDKSDDCLEFADNAKAKFGASDDLQIYHDGSNSRIQEGGTGSLLLRGSNLQLQDSDGFDYLTCTDGGDGGTVVLKHVGSTVFSTASGGVAVTGALTGTQSSAATAATFKVSDASAQVANVVVSNNADTGLNLGVFGASAGTAGMISASDAFITTSTTELNVGVNNSSGVIKFGVGSTASEKMRIDGTGVSIGTTTVDREFKVQKSGDHAIIAVVSGTSSLAGIVMGDTDDDDIGHVLYNNSNNSMSFRTNTSDAVTITSGGFLGVGETSPDSLIQVTGTNNSAGDLYTEVGRGNVPSITLQNAGTTDNNNAAIFFDNDNTTGASIGARFVDHSDEETQLRFSTHDGSSVKERIFIDGSGNFGINMIPAPVSNDKVLSIFESNTPRIKLHNSSTGTAGTDGGELNMTSSDFIIENRESGNLRLFTNGSERARFTSAGKLFINTTAAVRGSEQVSIDGGSADCFALKTHAAGAVVRKQSVTNGFIFLFENSSASAVGSITTDASNTTYNTSSDYRLKENIEPMQNGLDRLQQLNPVKFSWKETGIESEGFIAHEVDEVFSDCIYGEKDGEEIQSMDYGRITPLLVKAIQEQQEQIDALQSEIQSLKGE